MLMSAVTIISHSALDGTVNQLADAIIDLGGLVESVADNGVIECTMPAWAESCLAIFDNCDYVRAYQRYTTAN